MPEAIELILVRHAKAEQRDPVSQPDDSARRLTESGRRKMREAAAGLSRILSGVDWIITSPYARAAETAEILAPALSPGGGAQLPVDTCKELCPGGSVNALLAFLRKRPERRRIVLVGHDTDLSEMAAALIGARECDGLELKKGGGCLIRFDEGFALGAGQLIWWLTPSILRALD